VPLTTLLGVDVGGSGVKAACVDLRTGSAEGRFRIPTPVPATPDAVAQSVVEVAGHFEGSSGPISGPIGCTVPAVVTNGVVRTAANIDASWIDTDARALFTEATGRPCSVLNDADAAGVAEVRFGAACGVQGVVAMVTLGTGVGTALFVDGVLVPNVELGHVELDGKIADDWANAATRETHDLSWKNWSKRVDKYLKHLHALIWCDLIVLGGGVVKHSEKFSDRLDPGCEVRVAQLGNNAGIVGAALVAADASLAPSEREWLQRPKGSESPKRPVNTEA
jgi:polyphosphate glucokinase